MCIYVWECEGHVYVCMGTQRGKRTVSWSSHCPTALGTELGCWNASVPMGFRPLDGLTFWGCCDESSQMSWLTKNTNASCHRLSTGQMSDTSVPAIKSWVSKATVLWWYWERESFLAFCTLWTPPAFLGFSCFCSSMCLSASPHLCSSTSSQIVGEGSLFEWLQVSWTLLHGFSF